jgi:hypothetical protein
MLGCKRKQAQYAVNDYLTDLEGKHPDHPAYGGTGHSAAFS